MRPGPLHRRPTCCTRRQGGCTCSGGREASSASRSKSCSRHLASELETDTRGYVVCADHAPSGLHESQARAALPGVIWSNSCDRHSARCPTTSQFRRAPSARESPRCWRRAVRAGDSALTIAWNRLAVPSVSRARRRRAAGDTRTFRLCCRLLRGFAHHRWEASRSAPGNGMHDVSRHGPSETCREKVLNARTYGREPLGGLWLGPETDMADA